jgi:signal transduction histidine kinase/tetratricopeptide (TPR) repeat protein|nr:ATP-binding protein [Rhodoferax sp.]
MASLARRQPATAMQLFERNTEVDRLSEALQRSRDADQTLDLQVTLAWYLRQRDNTRAQQLLQLARTRIDNQPLSPALEQHRARLLLVEGETLWLLSDFDSATRAAHAALVVFESQGHFAGCADCHALIVSVCSSTGELPKRDAALAQAVDYARQAQDAHRLDFFEANQARYAVLRDVHLASQQWRQRFPDEVINAHPAVAAIVNAYQAARDHNTGNFAGALDRFNLAWEAALETGQTLTAVVAAVNAGGTYVGLNDHEAALEWLQRGLELARANGWAVTLGPCLRQMGEVMRAMGRLEIAQSLLDEALVAYQPLRNSRNFTLVLTALGDLAQRRGDYAKAFEHFQQQTELSLRLGQTDAAMEGQLGIAYALLQLGKDAEAGESALVALSLARNQGAVIQEIGALRLLARIHTQRGADAEATHCLEQALATARTVEGYLIPSELLFDLSAQYARSGEFAQAYELAIRASNARERVLNQEASNRATAIQVRLGTERSRAESEQHRRHAEAEAKRAALLQQSSDTLTLLGNIGQEITSQLDKEHVFEVIERHVHGLLDASSFAIYLMDADGQGLTSVYDVEGGVRLPSDHVRLDDEGSYSALCVREHRELLLDFTDPLLPANYVPGTLRTVSGLFAPLRIGDRVLGVMTIQSTRPQIYGENERLIFRTLCAYTAIALDNAVAYTHLRDAKDQLVVQEKLAALGSLVAGVAHELNTPIGNSLLTASTLQQNTTELEAAAASGTLRRSTLNEYMASCQEGLQLVIRGLNSASELVQSFKQVAVDRATEQRRSFLLLRTSQEVIATLHRSIHKAGHSLVIDIPDDIMLDGYPGPYGQVLTNLINNALLHAYGERKDGTIQLTAKHLRPGYVEVRFADDGMGIAPENLPRVFDPFFTTKLGQGGSGLGMSISYNIITSLFGGEFEVSSTPGAGTCFVMRLPLEAPQLAVASPVQLPR